jgi:hypothetical protein
MAKELLVEEVVPGLRVVEQKPWWIPEGGTEPVAREGIVEAVRWRNGQQLVDIDPMTVGNKFAASIVMEQFLREWRRA